MIPVGLNSLAHLFALIFAALASAFVALRFAQRSRARRALSKAAQQAIVQHLPALVRRRLQLVRPDAYGKLQQDRWEKEIAYFIDAHIAPSLPNFAVATFSASRQALELQIAGCVEEAISKAPAVQASDDGMSASEFELFCAEELRLAGWAAQLSPPGRDQGVDVVAELDGRRLVLQCKLHSRPIGNRAVQEVVAARGHERAQYAAVVSNQSYTTAAQQLAATNNVLLLHASDLRGLAARLQR